MSSLHDPNNRELNKLKFNKMGKQTSRQNGVFVNVEDDFNSVTLPNATNRMASGTFAKSPRLGSNSGKKD